MPENASQKPEDPDPDCSLCGGESCRGHSGPIITAARNGQRHRVCWECCRLLNVKYVAWLLKR